MPESLPLRILPFWSDSFGWDRFESFCLSVVRSLPEVKRADRYGVMGEDQSGIDIEADLHDGRKRTIQCRHRKQITKPQVQKAVTDTTYPADEQGRRGRSYQRDQDRSGRRPPGQRRQPSTPLLPPGRRHPALRARARRRLRLWPLPRRV